MLVNPPTWTQNGTYTAEQDRRLIGALVRTEGVAGGSGMVPSVVNNSRQVSIGSGGAYIHGGYSQEGGGGTYFVYNDGAHEVAIPLAGSLPRYDLVAIRVYDSAVSGSVNEARVVVVSGTPSTSPRIPAVPRSSIAIAAVKVNPGTTQINSTDISDQRVVAQMNGAVTGNVPTTQQTKLNQLASPSNPVLITPSSSPGDLQISTGGGFSSIGSSQVYHSRSDFPKTATEGTIATSRYEGRTYQMRQGYWMFIAGWGSFVTVGKTANDTSHLGQYIGGLVLNAGSPSSWGSEVPRSASDYSEYFGLVRGTSGTSLSRAGGVTLRKPGQYHVEFRYQAIAQRDGTAIRSRISAPGVSQFTAIDNQEHYTLIHKGQESTVTTSSTVTVSSAGNKASHGKIVPWIRSSAPITLSTVLMRVEMKYAF